MIHDTMIHFVCRLLLNDGSLLLSDRRLLFLCRSLPSLTQLVALKAVFSRVRCYIHRPSMLYSSINDAIFTAWKANFRRDFTRIANSLVTYAMSWRLLYRHRCGLCEKQAGNKKRFIYRRNAGFFVPLQAKTKSYVINNIWRESHLR